jgi:hypothetical protein
MNTFQKKVGGLPELILWLYGESGKRLFAEGFQPF